MSRGSHGSLDGARFGTTIRALLFTCASFCYMPRWNHTFSHQNIHRKSTLRREDSELGLILKVPSVNLRQTSVPGPATELDFSPFHKSPRSSYLEMKLLSRLERSAARPAVTRPLHAHTHTSARIHTHTHTRTRSHREELRLVREVLCQLVPVMDNCISIFTQVFHKNAQRGKRKPAAPNSCTRERERERLWEESWNL